MQWGTELIKQTKKKHGKWNQERKKHFLAQCTKGLVKVDCLNWFCNYIKTRRQISASKLEYGLCCHDVCVIFA